MEPITVTITVNGNTVKTATFVNVNFYNEFKRIREAPEPLLKRAMRKFMREQPPCREWIVKDYYDGSCIQLEQLPDELDSYTEGEVQEWFMWNRYMTATPSQYDCTGQLFTNWFKLTRRRGHWFAYHSIGRDV